LHRRGEDWRDRLAGWVLALGCDAWVLQRDVVAPADYIATWLGDAGEFEDGSAALRWLRWFDERDAEAAAVGWVILRRTAGVPTIRIEDVPQTVRQPLGPAVAGWLDATEWLRGRDDAALMACALRLAPETRSEAVSAPGPGGWEAAERTLALTTGFGWRLPTDEAVAALLGACDGERPLAAMVEVLSRSLAVPADVLRPAICAAVRELVERGLLLPPG
jgi:hypothetical protein